MSRKRARIAAVIGAVVVLGLATSAVSARGSGSGAMGAEPMMGEIALVAIDFAPRGYRDADGSLLPINSQNQALFNLYGIVYGGDGRTTFALPKLDPPLAGLKYIVAVQGAMPRP